jgi:hypothetical protein
VIVFAIASIFAYVNLPSKRHSNDSVPGTAAPGSLRAWSGTAKSNPSTARDDTEVATVEATPDPPPGPAAAGLQSVQPDEAEIDRAIQSPPDLGPEFIPESLQATIARFDEGLQQTSMQGRVPKSQLQYWSDRKTELDRATPDQWSSEMEARLGEFFESLPEAPAMRVEIACRPSQCLLRIIDTLPTSESLSYLVGAMSFNPGHANIRGILWRLVSQPWFKGNLVPGSNQMSIGVDSSYNFSLLRFARRRQQ